MTKEQYIVKIQNKFPYKILLKLRKNSTFFIIRLTRTYGWSMIFMKAKLSEVIGIVNKI